MPLFEPGIACKISFQVQSPALLAVSRCVAEQEEGSLGICKAIVMTVSFHPTDLEALNEIYLIHNIVYMYETVSGDLYLESQHLGGKGRKTWSSRLSLIIQRVLGQPWLREILPLRVFENKQEKIINLYEVLLLLLCDTFLLLLFLFCFLPSC